MKSMLGYVGGCLALMQLSIAATFCGDVQEGIVTDRVVGGYRIVVEGYHAECGQVHPLPLVSVPAWGLQIQQGWQKGWVLVSQEDFERYRDGDRYPRHGGSG